MSLLNTKKSNTHELETLFIERLATNLKRQAITRPSKWAETYRIMKNGPWRFKNYPWLRGMHDSQAEINVGKKAAQMGYTECVLNITFYTIDVLGRDVLYVLPNRTPDASDFSASRFDPALELSNHLSKLFSNVKNIGHKRAGSANLYVRGSQSRAGLKSIPVSVVILDEIEEFNVESVPLALERTSGQLSKSAWLISTPSIEDHGIDTQYKKSTQESFFFRCPCCDRLITLIWPDNVVVDETDPYYICTDCKQNILPGLRNALEKGTWVPKYPDRDIRGFYINQLYSPTITPKEFVDKYLESQLDPVAEQEFYNSKVGTTHTVKGSQLTDADIQRAIGTHKPGPRQGLITLGCDVGNYLHYEIDLWHLPPVFKTRDINLEARPTVLDFGTLTDFEQLDALMYQYNVRFCVIDAQPERRKAREFASRFQGRVRLCFYGRGLSGRQMTIHKDEPNITVDRTSWLDLALNRFRNDTISLPISPELSSYSNHLCTLVRRYRKDKDGNPMAEYLSGDKPDHYAHARNYAEMALVFASSMSKSYDISGIL